MTESVLDYIQASATMLTVALAAWAAWRSEISSRASQETARRSYELDLIRSYPFLRLENQTVGHAYFPQDHKYQQLQNSGGALVVFLTVRNIGGVPAVVDRLELVPTEGNGKASTTLSKFRAHTMPNSHVHYIPEDYRGSVIVEPGHSETVGAWFPEAAFDIDYEVILESETYPKVGLKFRPLSKGGSITSRPEKRRPVEVLEAWLNED